MADMFAWENQYRSTTLEFRESINRSAQDSDAKSPPVIDGFEDFTIIQLQELFQSNSSPKETSDAIAASFCRQKKPEECWYAFNSAFMSAAEYTDDDGVQKRLVQLILELCRRPVARNESGVDMELNRNRPFGDPPKIKPGEPIISSIGRLRYFADAPGFGLYIREAWNGPRSTGSYGEELDIKRIEFANLNSFLAHLTLAGMAVEDFPFGTWPQSFGLWTIAEALETHDQGKSEDWISAAAHWFQICGKAIYDNSDWGLDPAGAIAGYEGQIWKARKREDDSAGARWDLWMQRASELAAMMDVDEGVRGAARDCLREMSSVSGTTHARQQHTLDHRQPPHQAVG